MSARFEAARARAAAERRRQRLPDTVAADLGVIGGSGLYDMPGMTDVVEVRPETPFGEPSDAIVVGTLGQTRIAFVARHGQGHRLTPAEVPVRANLYALKMLGVGRVIAVSACGSMRTEIAPRDVVIPDQIIDWTRQRPSTFFGHGIVAHVGVADPFCPILSARLGDEAEAAFAADGGVRGNGSDAGRVAHRGGTYIAIEGPQFSTRAESHVYRAWEASVIGMTGAPEAKLAREAELCYGMLAFATDYDVWHSEFATVSVTQVLENFAANVSVARGVVAAVAERPIEVSRDACPCASALVGAIQTRPSAIDRERARTLALLVGGDIDPGPPA